MPVYTYSARDERGHLQRGQVEAESEYIAVNILQGRALIVTKIAPLSGYGRKVRRHRGIRLQDQHFFVEQTAILLEAGVPVLRALEIIAEQSASQRLYEVLQEMRTTIKSGGTFKDALLQQPRHFPLFWSHVVEAGEASGTLPLTLHQLAKNLELNSRIRSKIISAMIYPTILLAMSLLALFIFIFFVIPTFIRMFHSFNAKIPLFTLTVIQIAGAVRSYFFVIFAAAAAVVYLLKKYFSTPLGRFLFDRVVLSLPVFGTAGNAIIHARLSIILSTLIRSGLNLLKTLEIAANTTGNVIFKDAIMAVSMEVQKGKSLHLALGSNPLFSPMLVQMIMIGEESGKLSEMVDRAADYFQGQVDTFIQRVSAVVEPMILLIVGLVVGIVIVAMYLPLFSLATLVRG